MLLMNIKLAPAGFRQYERPLNIYTIGNYKR